MDFRLPPSTPDSYIPFHRWISVQPLLGVEGDPMRLLFEKDLTPHPQYCAAYKYTGLSEHKVRLLVVTLKTNLSKILHS